MSVGLAHIVASGLLTLNIHSKALNFIVLVFLINEQYYEMFY